MMKAEPGNSSFLIHQVTLIILFSSCLLDHVAIAEPAAPPLKNVFVHRAMGTDFEFILYARPGDNDLAGLQRVADEAFDAVDDLDNRISVWKTDSLITYVNLHAAREPVRVAPDLFDLLAYSRSVWEQSGGAFDISVGPLIKLWGFYKAEGRLPSEDDLRSALAKTGMDKVVLNREGHTVSFLREGMALDFGGIGKGLALDRASEILKRRQVISALLSAGTSSLVAIGAPPDRPAWTIRIRDPRDIDKGLEDVALRDESLSTSAAYENFIEIEGKKYGHIFDPRTGRPVAGMLSATAIAPTGEQSDALSTAFFVMGVEKTRKYCRAHPGARALLVPSAAEGTPQPVRTW